MLLIAASDRSILASVAQKQATNQSSPKLTCETESPLNPRICRGRAVLDLNTWLAAAAEDHDHDQDQDQDDDHDPDTRRDHDPSSSSPFSANDAFLNRARLDLDPPGFSCKSFQDLTVRLLCLLRVCCQGR